MAKETELERAMAWMMGRDTGTSSKAIMSKMFGGAPPWDTYPSDSADLGRCLRLLIAIPEWRSRIGEMSDVGHVWTALIARWGDLEATYLEDEANREMPGYTFKTTALMRKLIDGGLDADPLVTVTSRSERGIGSWSRGQVRTVSFSPGVSLSFGE